MLPGRRKAKMYARMMLKALQQMGFNEENGRAMPSCAVCRSAKLLLNTVVEVYFWNVDTTHNFQLGGNSCKLGQLRDVTHHRDGDVRGDGCGCHRHPLASSTGNNNFNNWTLATEFVPVNCKFCTCVICEQIDSLVGFDVGKTSSIPSYNQIHFIIKLWGNRYWIELN